MFNLAPVPVPNLQGKNVLVTGAGRGIGSYLVEILVENGAQVFAGTYGEPDANASPRLSGAEVLPLDVTSENEVNRTISAITNQTDGLDALVNNAGTIAPIGHWSTLHSADLVGTFQVNVVGLHRMTRAALPLLRMRHGTIINAGTGAATMPMEGWTAYCTTKAAARMMTLMFDLELKQDNIRSFFIGIPPTDTDMQARIRDSGLNPISQIAQSDLVDPTIPASVMAWLCSDAADALDEPIQDVRNDFFTGLMKG